uniref:GRB2-associated binding protein 1 n=1 Tax=Mastacembelus armatus TaxID=205130 RepID=A0A7N9B078_9TELE
MSGGDVVCSGWLRKSPPEKKLRRYAWKKRWFVLRSGRLTGDPDVLEYYKNDHAKKPIRVIDLNLCEQVDAGLTFNKKDLEHSFIFDIKTIDRVFYLVADTEEEMNKWVRCICDICGFNPTDDEAAKAAHQSVIGGLVVDTPPHPALGNIVGPAAGVISSVPPPYQPVSVRHLDSQSKPMHEPNYVPMTPSTMEFSSLGKQVPPPAHMGFRSSPKTPPRRPMLSDCQPPPVDRNLKPDRKGKPAPLEIKPLPEWEEPCTPVRSPVTRSFARDLSRFPMPARPPSVHSTASSTDSEDCDENYVAMVSNMSTDEQPNMKLVAPMTADGGSSPMVKPKGDKQVEYLDLDLDPGKSTPPRKLKSNGTAMAASDERVDYVVVDQQRTQALKSTREAWSDGRHSTETDTPSKGPK